jgi:hypothetical protein
MLRSQKLVGAFDTNPSAAPLTGSIAKRLHPDTEKSRRASPALHQKKKPGNGPDFSAV